MSRTTTSTPPLRAVAYCRVSTLLGQDPGIQLTAIQEVAKDRGFELVNEYIDKGVSGTRESRPALDELVKAARLGKFKVLIVTALDRLARNTRHLLNLMAEMDSYGVIVISIREGLDLGSPLGKAMLGLIGIVSQLERDLIADRIRTALAVKKLQAKQDGTNWRCGRPSKRGSEIAERVRAYRAEGKSIREIADLMKGLVSKSTIASILSKNPTPKSR